MALFTSCLQEKLHQINQELFSLTNIYFLLVYFTLLAFSFLSVCLAAPYNVSVFLFASSVWWLLLFSACMTVFLSA
jgi:hypothetical protein